MEKFITLAPGLNDSSPCAQYGAEKYVIVFLNGSANILIRLNSITLVDNPTWSSFLAKFVENPEDRFSLDDAKINYFGIVRPSFNGYMLIINGWGFIKCT